MTMTILHVLMGFIIGTIISFAFFWKSKRKSKKFWSLLLAAHQRRVKEKHQKITFLVKNKSYEIHIDGVPYVFEEYRVIPRINGGETLDINS